MTFTPLAQLWPPPPNEARPARFTVAHEFGILAQTQEVSVIKHIPAARFLSVSVRILDADPAAAIELSLWGSGPALGPWENRAYLGTGRADNSFADLVQGWMYRDFDDLRILRLMARNVGTVATPFSVELIGEPF